MTKMPRRKTNRRRKTTITEASRVGTTPTMASDNVEVPLATGAAAVAAAAPVASVPPPPTQCEQTSRMEQSVLDVREKNRPDQTADIYDNKTKEFLQFASHVYPNDDYKNSLNADKVYRFVLSNVSGTEKKGGEKENHHDLFRPN